MEIGGELQMRLVTFLSDGERRAGVLLDDRVLDINGADPELPADIITLLEGGPGPLKRLRQIVESTPPGSPAFRLLAEVRLLAPVPRPGKVLCVGRNYADHVSEAAAAGLSRMEKPSVFIKVSSAVIGPGEAIVRPVTTDQLDYEGELALVIGRRAKLVAREEALDCVAGYTIVNDVSARDLQFSKDVGISLGKNFDTALPMGPYLALADEVPDPGHLDIRTYVNGELRQDSNTHNLIFDIPHILWYLAQQLTLEPGDVIATGTPAGVGFAMKPPLWLQPGDVVRVEVQGLGALENPVVDG
jgi:2-keto-4-pentenoate hydratase/2-oxohepta-3-ene-1,7-dioic acid hydratase in catechol pathway